MRLKSTLTALALSLSALATLSVPAAAALAKEQDKPEPARVYKDWVVGCRTWCDAVAVLPEGDAEGYNVIIAINVGPLSYQDPTMKLSLLNVDSPPKFKGNLILRVDGKHIATFKASGTESEWTATLKRSRAVTIANGKSASIVDSGGNVISLVSLSGSHAALRDIDVRQENVGYTHALVAKGKKRQPAENHSGPYYTTMSAREVMSATAPPSSIISTAAVVAQCNDERDEIDAKFDAIYKLEKYENEADKALVLVGCGHGAYNYNVMPLMATKDRSGQWTLSRVAVIGYDYDDNIPMPMLTNPTWDAGKQELTHYNKGRGLGDCGDSAIYVWFSSGEFLTSEIREMPVCRGATHWPAIW